MEAGRTLEEDYGRLVDAARVAIAAEVEHRSRKALGAIELSTEADALRVSRADGPKAGVQTSV